MFDSVAPFAEVVGGDDVVFVRRMIEAFFPDAVRYAPGVVERLVGMRGVGAWLRKMFVYGRRSRYYRASTAAHTVTRAEPLELFRRAVRGRRYSSATQSRLFCVLALGVGLHVLERGGVLKPRRA